MACMHRSVGMSSTNQGLEAALDRQQIVIQGIVEAALARDRAAAEERQRVALEAALERQRAALVEDLSE